MDYWLKFFDRIEQHYWWIGAVIGGIIALTLGVLYFLTMERLLG